MARTPAFITRSYQQDGIAPAADAKVWSYQVPLRRVFALDEVSLRVTRQTVAGPAAIARVTVYITYPGRAPVPMRDLMLLTNGVGDERASDMSFTEELPPATIVEAHTSDTSTGGTTSMLAALVGTEKDLEP